MLGMIDEKTRKDIEEYEAKKAAGEFDEEPEKKEPIDPSQVVRKDKLMDHTPEEVKVLYQRGEMEPKEAAEYASRKDLMDNGLLGMNPKNVKLGYQQGTISPNEAKAYLEKQKNPWAFVAKEAERAVTGGILGGLESSLEFATDAANWLLPIQTLLPGKNFSGADAMEFSKEKIAETFPEFTEDMKHASTPYSTPGKLAEPFIQFAMPYGSLGKTNSFMKSGEITSRLMSGTFSALSKSKPKTAKFISRVTEETVRGGIVDFLVFDPFEEGLADMLDENTDLQSPIIDYLKTDPENSATVERLKNAAEGAVLGVALDGLLTGLRGTKAFLWNKHAGKVENVVEEVDTKLKKKGINPHQKPKDNRPLETEPSPQAKKGPKTDEPEAPSQVSREEPEGPKTDAQEGKTPEEPTQSTKETPGEEVEGEGLPTQQTKNQKRYDELKQKRSDLTATSIRTIEEFLNGADPEDLPDGKMIEMMSFDGSADTLFRLMRAHNAEGVAEAQARVTPQEKTVKKAASYMGKFIGKGTDEMMEALRANFGDSPELPAKVLSLSKIVKQYDKDIAKRLDNLDGKALEDDLEILEHMTNLYELQEMFAGVRSATGRTLDIFKRVGDDVNSRFDMTDIPKGRLEGLRQSGSKRDIERFLREYKKAKSPKTKGSMMKTVSKHGIVRTLLTLKQANLLWKPGTHLANILGNSMAYTNNSLKRMIALGLQAAVTGDVRHLGEAKAYLQGSLEGVMDAFATKHVYRQAYNDPDQLVKGLRESYTGTKNETGKFWEAFFSGEPQLDYYAKLDYTGDIFDKFNIPMGKGWKLPLGKFMKGSLHGLTAMDEVFSHLGYFSELRAQTYREGMKRGLYGQNLTTFAQKTLKDGPPVQIESKALANSREIRMVEDDFGMLASGLEKVLEAGGGIGKLISSPFYKVIVNLTKYAARNSPLGFASKRVLDQIKKGGVERAEALSGIAMGSAVVGAGAGLYYSNILVGRHPVELKEAYRNRGIPQYAIRHGDSWIDLDRFEPVSYILGTTADLCLLNDMIQAYDPENANREIDDRFQKLATAAILTVAEPILNKTMAEGIKETVDIVLTPQRKNLKNWTLKDQLKPLIPWSSLLDYTQRLNDDYQREIREFEDVFNSLFDRGELPIRRHAVFGTPLKEHELWPIPHLGPTKASTEREDAVTEEMLRIGLNKGRPADVITDKGASVKMNNEQYERYNELISQYDLQSKLHSVINHPTYRQSRNNQEKQKQLSKYITKARTLSKKQLLTEYPELRNKLIEQQRHMVRANRGQEDWEDPVTQTIRVLENQ